MPGLNDSQTRIIDDFLNGPRGALRIIEGKVPADQIHLIPHILYLCLFHTADLDSLPEIAKFGLTEAVEQIRGIFRHPCPQNRHTSTLIKSLPQPNVEKLGTQETFLKNWGLGNAFDQGQAIEVTLNNPAPSAFADLVLFPVHYKDVLFYDDSGVSTSTGFIFANRVIVSHLEEVKEFTPNEVVVLAAERRGVLNLTVHGPAMAADVKAYVKAAIDQKIKTIYERPLFKRSKELENILKAACSASILLRSDNAEAKITEAVHLITEGSKKFSEAEKKSYDRCLPEVTQYFSKKEIASLGASYNREESEKLTLARIETNHHAIKEAKAGRKKEIERIIGEQQHRIFEILLPVAMREGNDIMAESIVQRYTDDRDFDFANKYTDGNDALYFALAQCNIIGFEFATTRRFDLPKTQKMFKKALPRLRDIDSQDLDRKLVAVNELVNYCVYPTFAACYSFEKPFEKMAPLKKMLGQSPIGLGVYSKLKHLLDIDLDLFFQLPVEMDARYTLSWMEQWYDFVGAKPEFMQKIEAAFKKLDILVRKYRYEPEEIAKLRAIYKRCGKEEMLNTILATPPQPIRTAALVVT